MNARESDTMATLLTHRSHDVDDQAKSLSGWRQTYDQLGGGRFEGSAWQVVMRDGVLLRESTNRHLREQIVPPAGHVVLAVPLSVAPGSVFAGRPLERESLMVLSSEEEYDLVPAGEFDLVGLSLHRDAVQACLPAESMAWLGQAEHERNLALAPGAAAAIRKMLLAACAHAEQRIDALAERSDETALLCDTLTQTVLLAMAGEGSEHASSIPRRADTRLRVVKRAIAFMRANLHDDFGIAEISAAAFASRRSLQYCFEEFLHTTPQAYLRALRLNEARRSLKLNAGQPISSLANMLGFCSASHFTRHYKLMFDELPSETLKLNCYGPGV